MEHRQVRVLVIDDQPDFLVLWKLRLDQDPRFGEVHAASDGDEALEKLDEIDVDLVLADAWMPRSGYAVVEALARTHPHLPVVITSCAVGAEREALDRGAALYVDKMRSVTAELPDLLLEAVTSRCWMPAVA